MYVARATEEETYDYIISECNAIADYFLADVDDPMSISMPHAPQNGQPWP